MFQIIIRSGSNSRGVKQPWNCRPKGRVKTDLTPITTVVESTPFQVKRSIPGSFSKGVYSIERQVNTIKSVVGQSRATQRFELNCEISGTFKRPYKIQPNITTFDISSIEVGSFAKAPLRHKVVNYFTHEIKNYHKFDSFNTTVRKAISRDLRAYSIARVANITFELWQDGKRLETAICSPHLAYDKIKKSILFLTHKQFQLCTHN
jgi:hypothetical protein